MESRFAVESFVISAVGAELQLSYGRIQLCGGGRSQYCSELAPLVERPSDFLNPSIPDRKYMFRIGTCMKTNFDIDRRFRSAEVLSGSQPILLEFINLDLFQMALSDFSDVVFCF